MFNYDTLPEFCKECSSFARYDYINEFIDKLKEDTEYDVEKLAIPPNYYPPEKLIKHEDVVRKIENLKR